jgi:hypothetical protein
MPRSTLSHDDIPLSPAAEIVNNTVTMSARQQLNSRFERLSFVLGVLTGTGCNLSAFGLCFLISISLNALHPASSSSESTDISSSEMVAMLMAGMLVCGMAVAGLLLGNTLLTFVFRMVTGTTSSSSASAQESQLQDILNRFECRFLMGTIASGGATILLVLMAHWLGWTASLTTDDGSYHGVPWLLYSTEILLVFCFWSVYYCERNYLETCNKKDDEGASSLQTPLLASIV